MGPQPDLADLKKRINALERFAFRQGHLIDDLVSIALKKDGNGKKKLAKAVDRSRVEWLMPRSYYCE